MCHDINDKRKQFRVLVAAYYIGGGYDTRVRARASKERVNCHATGMFERIHICERSHRIEMSWRSGDNDG